MNRFLAGMLTGLCMGVQTLSAQPLTPSMQACYQAMASMPGNQASDDGNRVALFHTASEFYDDLYQAIRSARRYVHMEFYVFSNDSIGQRMLSLLREKSSQGVEVRLLIDGFGIRGRHPFSRREKKNLRAQGVDIRLFDYPVFPLVNHGFHTDHRKLVVVDGAVAYTGGMNVSDYYITGKPGLGEWLDTQARFEGPAVAAFEDIFSRMWFRQSGEFLAPDRYAASPGVDAEREYPGLRHDVTTTAGHKRVVVVDRVPNVRKWQMRRSIVAAVDAARDSICIMNPYNTNVRLVRNALYRALKRGVKVKIMVSSRMDNTYTYRVMGIQLRKLLQHGCQIFYYDGGFHHDKLMTVDGQLCSVGSTNLDGRSLMFDHEVLAFVFDRETTAQVDSHFVRNLQRCTPMPDKRAWHQRYPLGQRISGRILSAFRRFL